MNFEDYRLYNKVIAQAGLESIQSAPRRELHTVCGILDWNVKYLFKISRNKAMLAAWVDRVRPVGKELDIARSVYRQYLACELSALERIKTAKRVLDSRDRSQPKDIG